MVKVYKLSRNYRYSLEVKRQLSSVLLLLLKSAKSDHIADHRVKDSEQCVNLCFFKRTNALFAAAIAREHFALHRLRFNYCFNSLDRSVIVTPIVFVLPLINNCRNVSIITIVSPYIPLPFTPPNFSSFTCATTDEVSKLLSQSRDIQSPDTDLNQIPTCLVKQCSHILLPNSNNHYNSIIIVRRCGVVGIVHSLSDP